MFKRLMGITLLYSCTSSPCHFKHIESLMERYTRPITILVIMDDAIQSIGPIIQKHPNDTFVFLDPNNIDDLDLPENVIHLQTNCNI